MNPEYASKSGYGTSASVELAKNNIQITERHRMKALRYLDGWFSRMRKESMKAR